MVWSAPSEVCIQGALTNSQGALYGNRAWRVQYYDAATGGNALGAALTGTTLVDHDGRWSIALTPPDAVVNATGEVWYELAIDSFPAPDGRIDSQDVFPDRVKVESVLFAQRALRADGVDTADRATTASLALTFGGLSPDGYVTTPTLATGLAGKSDTGHTHNLQDLSGAVTDGQVPDALTISGGTVNNTPIGASTASTGAFTTLAANTVNTGQGANELYAMDQNVRTSDNVAFNKVTATTATFGSSSVTIGDDIVVASGGRVGLGTSSPAAVLDVDVAASAVLDQSQEAFSSSRILTSHWQSFTAGRTGLLAKVSFRPTSIPPTDATLKIYSGEGTGGALLHSQTGIGGTSMEWGEVELTADVPVSAGTQYTFELSQATSFQLLRADNLYPGGIYDNSPNADLVFRTYVLGAPADSLRVTSQMVIEPIATAPSTTTARLYNNGGDLYWNGTQLGGTGAGGDFMGDGSVAMTGNLNLGGNGIANLGTDLADGDVADDLTISGGTVNDTPIGASTASTGAFTTLAADTLDTGQGANELYAMDQNVRTSDAVAFDTMSLTGGGAPADQQSLPGSTSYATVDTSQEVAQTFTAGATGPLHKVAVQMRASTPSVVNLLVLTGSPTGGGMVLGSQETVTVTGSSWTVYEFAFATPPQLTAGQSYWFRLWTSGSVSTVMGMNPYAAGQLYAHSGSWTAEPTLDLWFQTYVATGTTDSFHVTGAARIEDAVVPPSNPAERLYNNGGNLYWNGTQLDAPLETPIGGTLLTVGDGTTVSLNGMAIGRNANGFMYGHGVGYGANANLLATAMGYQANAQGYGAAFGYQANAVRGTGAYSGSVAVGYKANAYSGDGDATGGVAVGYAANARHNVNEHAVGAVAMGHMANGYVNGVAVGGSSGRFQGGEYFSSPTNEYQMTSAYFEGVAVGFCTYAAYQGVAVGFRANGSDYGSAVGYRANAGYGELGHTFAKGAYSKVERYGEEWKGADAILLDPMNMQLVGQNKYGYGQVDFCGETADATPTEIFLGGVADKRFVLKDRSAVCFTARVVAIDTSEGDTSGWNYSGVIKRRSGTATTYFIGTPAATYTAEAGALSTDPIFTANTTYGSLNVTVTGVAATTVKWNAMVTYSEVRE